MGVFSLTGWARQIHTGLHVSRTTQDTTMSWHASNKGLSPAMAKLSRIFFSQFKYNNVVLQPQHCRIQHWFGLIPVRSPLLGESLLFSFPTGTKMFQFPALASCYARCHSFRMTGCPIRKSSDQRLFAPSRSLSQLITSFIASESQGIRHAPLLTFFQTFYSRTGIGSGIASFYQYCILEHVRFDIYF